MKNKKETSLERNNRTAMIAHFSDVTVMSIFWILQALSKVQPWAFVLIALVLGYAPVIAERYFFQHTRNQSHQTSLCHRLRHLLHIHFIYRNQPSGLFICHPNAPDYFCIR